MTGTMKDWLLERVAKIEKENTPLEMLIMDLKWQMTFMREEGFDWDHFQDTVQRAREESGPLGDPQGSH